MTEATTADFRLYNCDAIVGLKCVKSQSIDAVISDPPYAEINRKYGRFTEPAWHDLMDGVVEEVRRVLKPGGNALFIVHPNYKYVGSMRLWVWEFLLRTAEKWNLIQDAYWWNPATPPLTGTGKKYGLLRGSLKYCLWFGSPNSYRDQLAVSWETAKYNPKVLEDRALKYSPSGGAMNNARCMETAEKNGGSTPLNVLPLANRGNGTKHGATTPIVLADWWTRYLTKPGDIVLDPFSGTGTMGVAALQNGRQYLGFDLDKGYHDLAEQRLEKVELVTPVKRPKPKRKRKAPFNLENPDGEL